MNLSDRLDQIPDHLRDVHSALNDLLPLIEESSRKRSLKYQREADQLISEEARCKGGEPAYLFRELTSLYGPLIPPNRPQFSISINPANPAALAESMPDATML